MYIFKELETMKEGTFHFLKLTNGVLFETNFIKVDQHRGGTKHRKDNQVQCTWNPM